MIVNQDKNACPYNDGVVCESVDRYGNEIPRYCEACGWNPDVARERLEQIAEARKTRKKPQ